MSVNRYSTYPASFVHAGGTLALPQMGSASQRPGSNLDEIVPGGSIDRGAVVLRNAMPEASIKTADLATLLATVSPTIGLAVTGAGTFRYQRRAEGGVFAGGSTGITIAATSGFLFPQSLMSSEDSMAMLDLGFIPFYDGTNHPWVATGSVALSGATPAFTSVFYHGPTYINGSQLEGSISTRVDFGLRFDPTRADGTVFPRGGSIVARRPRITFGFLKGDVVVSDIASMFIAAAAGTIATYFRKGTANGTRVADGTAQHCKISAAAGALTPDEVSVNEEDDLISTITIMPTAAMSVSVASAIP